MNGSPPLPFIHPPRAAARTVLPEVHVTETDIPVEADLEDAISFLSPLSSGHGPILEVHQVWGNLIVDSRQFEPSGSPVRIGDGTSTRWLFLGVDMGRIPAGLRPLLAALAPLWSDFEAIGTFDFRVPEGVDDGWALFEPDDAGGFVARIPIGWDAVVARDGASVAVSGEVPMRDVDGLVISRGAFRFVARGVPRAVRIDARFGAPDPGTLALLGAAAALFLGVVFLAGFSGPVRTVAEQEVDEPLRAMMLESPAARPEVAPGASSAAGAARASLPRDRKSSGAKIKTPKPGGGRNAGLLSGDLGEMLGSGLPGELVAGVGQLIGGRGSGIGGDGFPGAGGGCPGGACGGTYEGHDGSGLRGDGPRGGKGGHGPGKQDGGSLRPTTEPIVIGSLDRADIDEVVKNQTAAIRYCYQRELQRTPGLGGKIAVKFTIARDGSVSAASVKSSTMGAPAVESCIVSRFLRMQFPEPKGGGIVVVSYPFLFAPN